MTEKLPTAPLALHHSEDVEVEGLDGEAAALLGEEGALANLGHLVALAVIGFLVLLDLLAGTEVLGPEALVAGQFVDARLAQGDLGVYLIGDDDLLALIGVGIAHHGTGKESVGVDFRGGLGLLRPGVVSLATLLLGLLLLLPLLHLRLTHFLHFDGEARRRDFLAVDSAGGGTDGEGALDIGQQPVAEGCLNGV